MPIYEYRCAQCGHKVAVFWRTFSAVDESKARCTNCGSAKLSKLASRVRVIRGGSRSEENSTMPAGGDTGDNMMPDMDGLDENDPRSLGRFMRKMAGDAGEDMGPEFNEVIGRLEKGEDPEKIEQSMGDMFGTPEGAGGMDDDMGMPPAMEAPAETEPADAPTKAKSDKKSVRAVRAKSHTRKKKK
jgi:putative FmdB family regulatory protein